MLVTSAALVQLRVGFSAAFNRGMGNVVTLADKIATTVPSSTASNLYGWLGPFPACGNGSENVKSRRYLKMIIPLRTNPLSLLLESNVQT